MESSFRWQPLQLSEHPVRAVSIETCSPSGGNKDYRLAVGRGIAIGPVELLLRLDVDDMYRAALGVELPGEPYLTTGKGLGPLLVVQVIDVVLNDQDEVAAEILGAVIRAVRGCSSHRLGLQHLPVGACERVNIQRALAVADLADESTW